MFNRKVQFVQLIHNYYFQKPKYIFKWELGTDVLAFAYFQRKRILGT